MTGRKNRNFSAIAVSLICTRSIGFSRLAGRRRATTGTDDAAIWSAKVAGKRDRSHIAQDYLPNGNWISNMYNMVAYIGTYIIFPRESTHKNSPKRGMYAVEEQEDIGVHSRKEIDNFGIYPSVFIVIF